MLGLRGSLEYIDYTYKSPGVAETEPMLVGTRFHVAVIAFLCQAAEHVTRRLGILASHPGKRGSASWH